MRVESSPGYTPSRARLAIGIGLVVIFWAVNFIAAKIGLRHLPPLTMASFRVVLAGFTMVPVYLFRHRLPGFAGNDSPRQRFSGSDLWTFAYLGFFGVA